MTIGEALKKERLKLGLSKYQFSRGIIDPKFYGKVENDNRNIGSRALVRLILVHHIDVGKFFQQIKDDYASKEDMKFEKLNYEMSEAVIKRDVKKIKIISEQFAPDSIEYLRSQVFLIYLNHQKVAPKLVTQIQKVLDEHEKFFQDIQTVRLFSNALPILPIEQINYFMKVVLNKAGDREVLNIEEQRRIAQLCNNYLQTCLDRNIFSKNIEKVDRFFEKITNPEMLIYKLLEKRDYYLLKNKQNEAKRLTEFLRDFGYQF